MHHGESAQEVLVALINISLQVFSAPNYVDQSGNKGAFVCSSVNSQQVSNVTHHFGRSASTLLGIANTRNSTRHLILLSSPWRISKEDLVV